MRSPFLIVTSCNTLLAISAAVVLGISAYVEHTTGKLSLHSSQFIYDAFVGAFTIAIILALVIGRLIKPSLATLKVEVGVSALLWVFWLAAGIATTQYTEGDRAFSLLRKVLASTCRDLHAQLAFVWIGFVILTLTSVYMTILAARQSNTGWIATLREYEHDVRSRADPFADPVGQAPGSVVGVASDEDPDFKP